MTSADYLLLCALEHLARQALCSETRTRAPAAVYAMLTERGWLNQRQRKGGPIYFTVSRSGKRELECWLATQASCT